MTQQLHRMSTLAIIVLSLTALLMVLWGYTQLPLADEGAPAHVFQLAMLALLPSAVVSFTTADWRQPWRSAWPLAFGASVAILALAALYVLEHVYYPDRFPAGPSA